MVLAHTPWVEFTKAQGLDPADPANLAHPRLIRVLLRHLDSRLAKFPKYARIRRVHVLLEPWTPENGLLTPALKIRRKVLQQRYAAQIEALYNRHGRAVNPH